MVSLLSLHCDDDDADDDDADDADDDDADEDDADDDDADGDDADDDDANDDDDGKYDKVNDGNDDCDCEINVQHGGAISILVM